MIGSIFEKMMMGILLIILTGGALAQVISGGIIPTLIFVLVFITIACLNPIITCLQKRGYLP